MTLRAVGGAPSCSYVPSEGTAATEVAADDSTYASGAVGVNVYRQETIAARAHYFERVEIDAPRRRSAAGAAAPGPRRPRRCQRRGRAPRRRPRGGHAGANAAAHAGADAAADSRRPRGRGVRSAGRPPPQLAPSFAPALAPDQDASTGDERQSPTAAPTLEGMVEAERYAYIGGGLAGFLLIVCCVATAISRLRRDPEETDKRTSARALDMSTMFQTSTKTI